MALWQSRNLFYTKTDDKAAESCLLLTLHIHLNNTVDGHVKTRGWHGIIHFARLKPPTERRPVTVNIIILIIM